MIKTNETFGITTITCDGDDCEEQRDCHGFGGHVDFQGAIDEIKDLDWKVIKEGNDWGHYCPECGEEREDEEGN